MKKILVINLALGFFVFKGTAQVQREVNPSQNSITNPGQKSEKFEMMKSLNLSKQQMGEIKEFRRSIKQKKDEISNDQTLTPEQKETKMKELRMEQKEKLNTILTPEQIEKLQKERKNFKMEKATGNKDNNS